MGILYVVATPIGNLSDISKRALETLENASIVLAEDTRVTKKLLDHFDIKKEMISYHKFNELNKLDYVIDILKEKDIALVSDAGTPLISDPGYFLVEKARNENIEVVAIPGPSAFVSALSASGMDTNSFAFFGFLNHNKIKKEIAKIFSSNITTIALYESPNRIVKLLEALQKKSNNIKICVFNDLTKLYEKTYYGLIDEVIKEINLNPKKNKGEYTVVFSYEKEEKEIKFTIEAYLMDKIIKGKTMKEAIKEVALENDFSKNEVYTASLNLKSLLK